MQVVVVSSRGNHMHANPAQTCERSHTRVCSLARATARESERDREREIFLSGPTIFPARENHTDYTVSPMLITRASYADCVCECVSVCKIVVSSPFCLEFCLYACARSCREKYERFNVNAATTTTAAAATHRTRTNERDGTAQNERAGFLDLVLSEIPSCDE